MRVSFIFFAIFASSFATAQSERPAPSTSTSQPQARPRIDTSAPQRPPRLQEARPTPTLNTREISRDRLGGATSGGGDSTGINAQRIAEGIFELILTIGDESYSAEELAVVSQIKSELRIVMTEEDLPVSVDGKTQNGFAYSVRTNSQSTMFLNRHKWESLETLLEKEVLIHHEIMVLAGIEATGEYHASLEFERNRQTFWRAMEDKSLLCNINVFAKGNIPERMGAPVGSTTVVNGAFMTKSDFGYIGTLTNGKALIWRGVIDSLGFFRMQLDEVSHSAGRQPVQRHHLDLGTLRNVEPMRVYFDPYQIERPLSNPIYTGSQFVIAVNCNHF